MNGTIIPIKKRRTMRRLKDALNMIERGNRKILETYETLGPTLTTREVDILYESTRQIMNAQINMYRELISEKEEE